jgi:hypothetical protein
VLTANQPWRSRGFLDSARTKENGHGKDRYRATLRAGGLGGSFKWRGAAMGAPRHFGDLSGANLYRGIPTFIKALKLNKAFEISWKGPPAHPAIRYILQGLTAACATSSPDGTKVVGRGTPVHRTQASS